jgi:hypothetical protein
VLDGSACAVDVVLGEADGVAAAVDAAAERDDACVDAVLASHAVSVPAATPASIPRKARRSVVRPALTWPGYVAAL